MIPRTLIATADIPGNGGSLRLLRRGDEFSIMLGANELMNSRLSGSEAALATLTASAVGAVAAPRWLVGGLGMGFTLRALLAVVGDDAAVSVAELVPEVVDWARGPMAPIFAGCLDDRRVTLHVEDVAQSIARGDWSAVLLDVDNGPDGLTRASNDRLYSAAGLRTCWQALRPGGVLAVWSSAGDQGFTHRLAEAGFAVTEHRVRARAGRGGAHHHIWAARRPR